MASERHTIVATEVYKNNFEFTRINFYCASSSEGVFGAPSIIKYPSHNPDGLSIYNVAQNSSKDQVKELYCWSVKNESIASLFKAIFPNNVFYKLKSNVNPSINRDISPPERAAVEAYYLHMAPSSVYSPLAALYIQKLREEYKNAVLIPLGFRLDPYHNYDISLDEEIVTALEGKTAFFVSFSTQNYVSAPIDADLKNIKDMIKNAPPSSYTAIIVEDEDDLAVLKGIVNTKQERQETFVEMTMSDQQYTSLCLTSLYAFVALCHFQDAMSI